MVTRRRSGFTLIELLVVIAIMAILAAMLFPVFARARESARKIQCLSNVRNIATAVQMYLSDYDRFPPTEHRQEVLDAVKAWTAEDRGCDGATHHTDWAPPTGTRGGLTPVRGTRTLATWVAATSDSRTVTRAGLRPMPSTHRGRTAALCRRMDAA